MHRIEKQVGRLDGGAAFLLALPHAQNRFPPAAKVSIAFPAEAEGSPRTGLRQQDIVPARNGKTHLRVGDAVKGQVNQPPLQAVLQAGQGIELQVCAWWARQPTVR